MQRDAISDNEKSAWETPPMEDYSGRGLGNRIGVLGNRGKDCNESVGPFGPWLDFKQKKKDEKSRRQRRTWK